MFRIVTRTVWILSVISLCTDLASEMLYPVLPVYLQSLGYSVFLIGLLEGVAEAVAGLSKGYFGKMSDQQGRRVPFVQWGYFLSAVSKPVMGLLTSVWVIFASRSLDRIGKGVRTGARDALLAMESVPADRGKIFGFHRSMDTLGAVAGPLLALIYLYYNPGAYAHLFLWAVIPGMLAVLLTFLLKEKATPPVTKGATGFFSFVSYWKAAAPDYRKLVGGLLVFAAVNSSDVFLLLLMKSRGATDTEVIGIYIFYNLVYALSALPLGMIADAMGLRKMLTLGLCVFSIVYAGMSVASETWMFVLLFALYGVYAAATEGISKAMISNSCKKEDTATAIGTYTAFQSIAAILASSLAGWVWYAFGPEVVFIYAAIASAGVAFWVLRKVGN